MVTVFVGPENESFVVHQDLLTLHSRHLQNYIQNMENVSESKIALPSIKPSLFADFVSWIYTDNFLPVESTSLGVTDPCTELWAMGNFLQVKPSLEMTLLFPRLEIDLNY
jgi:hypothetical protein